MQRVEIQVVTLPVSDADRAKEFYAGRLGWHVDHDQVVNPELRFVQITPPNSACSITFGQGLSTMAPGSLHALMAVIDDADAALAELRAAGVDAQGVDEQAWGRFVTFADPDGNSWTLQQLPARG
jgi:catechol 2,3-dioxygenase-like lactoylglutathione lyase family enzyme